MSTSNPSLPSRGAWIEIPMLTPHIRRECRSPHGERGLKCRDRRGRTDKVSRRSPHGERGLKCVSKAAKTLEDMSLPSRGAWIEIQRSSWNRPWQKVAPLTGSVD